MTNALDVANMDTVRPSPVGAPATAPGATIAFGQPGLPPRWTTARKDAVGTAYSASSRIRFTVAEGIVTEVYFPTLDRPQLRDLQFLITDGRTFFHDERRDCDATVEPLSPHALGFRVITNDRDGQYRLIKEIIADPHQACVLIHLRVEAKPTLRPHSRIFVLAAPHLESSGWGNTGQVLSVSGRTILSANKGRMWAGIGASVPFRRASCGYVGASDGWTDLADNLEMDWAFQSAPDGNIALTGELDLRRTDECVVGLALCDCPHGAMTALFQSLGVRFATLRRRAIEQWERGCKHNAAMERLTGDGATLYHLSQSLLLAHEDKTYPGAMIALLSIPWGEHCGDEDIGGYHLVWTRDMVSSATGLLAAGNTATPLRALIYLAASQLPDGGFYQNFFVSGEPHWRGVQLDEVAFPILLARRLHQEKALDRFDPYVMVLRAAGFLIRNGPATAQERWEEASGYSPSTLAVNIAALLCAAAFARERGEPGTAQYLEEYADFLECHIEAWTVTTAGSLLPGVPRHDIRIDPVRMDDVQPDEDPNAGILRIANRAPGAQAEFPARDVVDAGFLELVRYGVRAADDPLMQDSLRVVDAVLRVDAPAGPAWRRYNHDGYGQRDDGGAYAWWGTGRAWPLLTGERGHYELAAHGDAESH